MTKALSRAGEKLPTAGPRHLSRELMTRWELSLREWSAPPRVFDAWRALDDPRTRIVITGQQPGPWGGPLYTLYKAATAVALAERIASRGGGPVISVFWMQSEDTDWGEIGWGALPHRDLRLYRHRYDAVVPARHWVGSAELTDPPEASAVMNEWNANPGEAGPCLEPYELGRRFALALLKTFGHQGLLPLDGRWPELRQDGRALWERYVPRHRQLARDVVMNGTQQTTLPLDEAAASHGLFVLDGEKRRPVDPRTWESEVTEALAANPARLAPSVLLRAPLQDHLFGPVAHVVGSVEGAYLEQLRPVYTQLGVAEPLRVPRLSTTVFPKGLVPSADWDRVLLDPETWIAERAMTHLPGEARRTVVALRQEIETAWERLDRELGNEQEMTEILGSARRKIDLELKRVEEMLERRVRRELYRAQPALRHLAEFLRPRRGPQERGLSGASLYLLFGEDLSSMLADVARSHLAALDEGRTAPQILEATRV